MVTIQLQIDGTKEAQEETFKVLGQPEGTSMLGIVIAIGHSYIGLLNLPTCYRYNTG